MADVTITLPDMSAQDLAVLVAWISNGLDSTFTDQRDTKLVLKLHRALDAAEYKQWAAERIDV